MKKRALIIGMFLSFILGGSIVVYAANKINSNVVLYRIVKVM